jgi:hypothetical protein
MLSLGTLEWCRVLPRNEARLKTREEFTRTFRTKVKSNFGSGSRDRFEFRGPHEMVLTVYDCGLLRAFRSLGIEGLAPYLCQTDEVYLGALGPGIGFRQEAVLAGGAPRCVFRFLFQGDERTRRDGARAVPTGETSFRDPDRRGAPAERVPLARARRRP